jgi:protein O-mannosyl-transferase
MITKFWLYATIALLALAACVVSLKFGLVYDDDRAEDEQRAVQGWTDVNGMMRQHAPLRQLSLAADATVWGKDWMDFHVTNLALHALASLALLALLRRLLGRQPAAQWAAGLFALLPIGASAVSVVAHRNEMIGTLLILLACLAWLRPQRDWRAWTVGGVFAALAAVETSMSLMLPLLLVAYDLLVVAPSQPERLRPRLVETGAAALAVTTLHLAHCWWINHHGYWQPESWEIAPALSEWPVRLLRDWPAGVWVALRWLVVPLPFDVDHGLTPASLVATLAGITLFVALVNVILSQARPRPLLALGVAWVLAGCAVAALSVFRSHYGAIAESELYAVAPGLCLLAGLGIGQLCKLDRVGTRFWVEVGALATVALALVSWSNWRSYQFESDGRMLATTLANHPDSGLAHLKMGRHCIDLMRQSSNPKVPRIIAEKEFQKAIELHWDYYETYGNLGVMALNRRDYTQAEVCFRKALELNPTSFGARLRLANALHGQQRFEAAREIYKQLLTERPRSVDLYQLIGDTYALENRASEAEPFFRQASRLADERRQERLVAQRKNAGPEDDAPPAVTLPAPAVTQTNAAPKRK